jgi:hypothetical protein
VFGLKTEGVSGDDTMADDDDDDDDARQDEDDDDDDDDDVGDEDDEKEETTAGVTAFEFDSSFTGKASLVSSAWLPIVLAQLSSTPGLWASRGLNKCCCSKAMVDRICER